MRSNLASVVTFVILYSVSILAVYTGGDTLYYFGKTYKITTGDILEQIGCIAVACVSLLLPAVLRAFAGRRRPSNSLVEGSDEQSFGENPGNSNMFLVLSVLLVVAALIQINDYGFSNLLRRGNYLDDVEGLQRSRGGLSLITELAHQATHFSPLIFMLAFLRSRLGPTTVVSGGGLLLTLFFHYAKSGRSLSLYFVELLVAYELSPRRFGVWGPRVLAIGMATIGYGFALHHRLLGVHGFMAYAYEDFRVLSNPGDWLDISRLIATNLALSTVSFHMTVERYSGQASLKTLWMMLTPAPGSWAGWHDTGHMYRLISYMPYCAIGELYTFGLVAVAAYYTVVGLLLAAADALVRRFNAAGLVVSSFAVLAVLMAAQYNLRTVTRLYYIIVIFSLVCWIVSQLARRRS